LASFEVTVQLTAAMDALCARLTPPPYFKALFDNTRLSSSYTLASWSAWMPAPLSALLPSMTLSVTDTCTKGNSKACHDSCHSYHNTQFGTPHYQTSAHTN
jgi:hypothetical protein